MSDGKKRSQTPITPTSPRRSSQASSFDQNLDNPSRLRKIDVYDTAGQKEVSTIAAGPDEINSQFKGIRTEQMSPIDMRKRNGLNVGDNMRVKGITF
jgi:hypothetical protein